MNMRVARERYLRALGVEPLRLRGAACSAAAGLVVDAPAPLAPAAAAAGIHRLALQPDHTELDDPALRQMYTALTEAVGKAGLERVRVCDVADDPSAAVLVFGTAQVPGGVPAVRVLRTDPLHVLHTDRERKRQLWERMQALGRGEVR